MSRTMALYRGRVCVAGLVVAMGTGGGGSFAQESSGEEKPAEPVTGETAPAAAGVVRVKMETTLGDIILELDQAKSPLTVANFLGYADEGHYAGTVFHRVISDFMIQGGGMTPEMDEKPGAHEPIPNESTNGHSNVRGTIVMARTGDPHSATSQFFINVVDNKRLDASPNAWVMLRPGDGFAIPEDMADRVTYDPATRRLSCKGPLSVEDRDRLLPLAGRPLEAGGVEGLCSLSWGYCVFGKVVEGMDVVDKIRDTPVAKHPKYPSPQPCTPVEPVVIKSVTRVAE